MKIPIKNVNNLVSFNIIVKNFHKPINLTFFIVLNITTFLTSKQNIQKFMAGRKTRAARLSRTILQSRKFAPLHKLPLFILRAYAAALDGATFLGYNQIKK